MHRIGILANLHKDDAISWALHATNRLREEAVEVLLEDGLHERLAEDVTSNVEHCPLREFAKHADLVITFGGDGTLLAAAHHLIGSDVPIMGVNVGKLGFLAEFPVSSLDDAIMDVVKGNYRIVDRSTLQITIDDVTTFALNEILLERASEAKMIAVRAFVNEHHVADYRADGVIITTPTGSTAYSLASGGPIIVPSADVFCITPISPHTLTLRPLIIRDDSEVRFEIPFERTSAQIVADGRIIGVVNTNNKVIIRKSEYLIKLVKRADSNYFDLLREKLLWSADAVKNKS